MQIEANHVEGAVNESIEKLSAAVSLLERAVASLEQRDAAMSGEAAILSVPVASPAATRRRRWLRRYLLAVVGGAVIAAWALAALLAPWISPYEPSTVDVVGRLAAPSFTHWLGTDELGRDVLTRCMYGAQLSLTVGFLVVLASLTCGTVLGVVSGYVR